MRARYISETEIRIEQEDLNIVISKEIAKRSSLVRELLGDEHRELLGDEHRRGARFWLMFLGIYPKKDEERKDEECTRIGYKKSVDICTPKKCVCHTTRYLVELGVGQGGDAIWVHGKALYQHEAGKNLMAQFNGRACCCEPKTACIAEEVVVQKTRC